MTKRSQERDQASSVIETQVVRDGHIGYSDNIHLLYMELLSMGVSVTGRVHGMSSGLLPAKSNIQFSFGT